MPKPGLRVGVIAFLLLAASLAGCMAEVPVPPEPGSDLGDEDSQETAMGGSDRLLVGNLTEEQVRPWLVDLGEVYREPAPHSLVQYAYESTGFGALRLLSDGQAFFVVVDASLGPLPEGTVALARVFESRFDHTIARGAEAVVLGGQTVVPVASHEMVRMGNDYAFEVLLVALGDPGLAGENLTSLDASRLGDTGVDASVVHAWDGPLSFRASWTLGFDGPEAGRDRHDLFEDDLFGGPDVGTYTMTIRGERIWVANILMEFGDSRVVGTEPQAYSNGTTSVAFQLEGVRALPEFLELLPDRGLDQSFKMVVRVDYQAREELAGEETQYFYLTADVGYRLGGSTYVDGTSGKTIAVVVEKRLF